MEPLRSDDTDLDTCAERRASRRVRVTCAATLQTMTTMTHGILGDISESGARFVAEEPPGKGATALLKWGTHEAVCTIIWHDEGACGLWFKHKLAPELVAETSAMDRVVEMPIASVGNITQGRKRTMGFLRRAPVEEPAEAVVEPPEPHAEDVVAASEPDIEPEMPATPPFLAQAPSEPDLPAAVAEGARISDVIRAAFRFRAPDSQAVELPVDDVPEIEEPESLAPVDRQISASDPEIPAEPPATDHPETEERPLFLEPPPVREEVDVFEEVEEFVEVEPPEYAADPEAIAEPEFIDELAPATEPAFGRTGGLPPPTIGHSPTLAEVLRRYRTTGSWER
jgi:hypothetical protein